MTCFCSISLILKCNLHCLARMLTNFHEFYFIWQLTVDLPLVRFSTFPESFWYKTDPILSPNWLWFLWLLFLLSLLRQVQQNYSFLKFVCHTCHISCNFTTSNCFVVTCCVITETVLKLSRAQSTPPKIRRETLKFVYISTFFPKIKINRILKQ